MRLAHLGGTPYSRAAIEAMVMPLKDLADPELVLFVEDDGQAVGWFPAIPNFNEILIKLGGLRRPWDYVKALRFRNLQAQVPGHQERGSPAGVLGYRRGHSSCSPRW